MPESKNGVVIVTYNRLELLKECLDAVRSQTIPFTNIIVVNNCSLDGTREYLEQCSDPELLVLHQEENLGGAGGFYEGLQEARKLALDWVLLIDDDAMIAPDYMEQLLTKKEEWESRGGQKICALAGSVRTDGQIDLSHRRRVSNGLLFRERFVSEKEYQSKTGHPPTCDCATFCGLVIRGSVIEEIGLPKKEYFLWYDDVEYCLRLRKRGGIRLVKEAVLNHKTVASREGMVIKGLLQRIGWRQYYGYRNRYDTARIHFGPWSAFFVALEYHVLAFCSRCMTCRKSTREKGRYNVTLIHDALRDGKQGVLGKHADYHP